jgi:hypothetical protein
MEKKLTQRGAFAVCLTAGAILAHSLILAPLHERSHQFAAELEGTTSHITGWSTIAIDVPTPYNLAAGYYGEVSFFLVLFAGCFFFFNGSYGVRKPWALCGFPLGYATWSWLTPLLFRTDDFFRFPGWTETMRLNFFFDPGFFLLIGWGMVFLFRLRHE